MSILSFNFFVFLLGTAIVYYLFPGKFRYLVLFAASGAYYVYAAGWKQALVLLGFIMLFYGGSVLIGHVQDERKRKLIFVPILLVAISGLIILKYLHMFTAPLGIMYWMLIGIAFLTDCYYGTIKASVNPLKTGLFLGFFPIMTSGPFYRYNEVEKQLNGNNRFSYENLTFGVQRIVWGAFKKLIISERLAVIVNTIYAGADTYKGSPVLLGIFCFALQLYTDFSGCMDVVIGAAQIFGIRFPENFQTPFFSKGVSEFWRRWHITLGAWLKDYVLYPLLHCELWRKWKKHAKKVFGKKRGELPPLYAGMFLSWFLIGLWHGGGWKYVFGVGIWFWFIIVLGEVLSPLGDKLANLFRINRNCFSWKLFQVVRTFLFVCFGLSFFRGDSIKSTLLMWRNVFTAWNPQMVFGKGILSLGLDLQDLIVTIVALMVLFTVSLLQQKGIHIRQTIARQNLVFRWILYLALFFAVLIFGKYGVEYDAANFIYQGL